jgi:predicted nucleic acid-binding protein
LLALAEAANADYLVTGDKKSGLLGLRKHRQTRIVTARQFGKLLGD